MKGIVIPEMIIYKALESIIQYIRKDINEKDDDTETILYKLLGEDEDGKPMLMNRYNYFVQARKIFMDESNLSVNFGFNFEVAKLLSLHIILPSESPGNSAIGQDEGYAMETLEDGTTQVFFTQDFQSNYQIMITGTNGSEVLVVYHVMKSMLLSIIPHLELMGLRLNKLSGNDVMFRDEYMPNGTFQKVINLNFNYELKVPRLLPSDIFTNVIYNGHVLPDSDSVCDLPHE